MRSMLPVRAMLLLALVPIVTASATAADADAIRPEEVTRGFRTRTLLAKPRANLSAVERAEAAAGLELLQAHPRLGGWRTLQADGGTDIKEVIAKLVASGLYEYVEPDYLRKLQVLPDDARFAEDQWSLNNTGQSGGAPGADIKAAAAWNVQHDAPDVIVAVVDSGVALWHDDIVPNLWVNTREQGQRPSIDDDGNGYIDDFYGIDATVAKNSQRAGDPSDVFGHGSHVAGIIGAVGNNGIGISGVAWKVQIMALKAGRSGTQSVSATIACIDYAIAQHAHIINGSYGSSSFSQAEYDALKRARDAGIIFVAAAGNDSQEITDAPEYPAAYALDNIVAVASTTRQDRLANYSTYGSGLVELAAPGSSILSLGFTKNAPYVTLSGTSMAAPHVSGALALLKQRFPDDNYRGLINRLLNSVDVLPALDNRVHTNGRLNLQRALTSTDPRPFNDDFARRAVISGDINTVRGSNQFATVETGEPVHAGVAGANATLWWSWTAPAGAGKVAISTAGSDYDTVLALYSGSSLATLTPVAGNDDASASTATSSITAAVVPGTTYAIAVASKGGGHGLLSMSVASIPLHDAFAAAEVLTGPSITVRANNAAATSESGEPKPKNSRGTAIGKGNTLWYKWTAPTTRRYQISATAQIIDPVVAVYTGTSLANLVEVASNDDSDSRLYHFDSLVSFAATANVTYYIMVDVSSGSGGRFSLSVSDAEWQSLTFLPVYASPAIGPDGTVYVVDGLGLLEAMRSDGTAKWVFLTDDFDFVDGGATAVGADGTIYFGTLIGKIYAVNPDGTRKWAFTTQSAVWAAPAIAADGTIYVKSDDGSLYALEPGGAQKWRTDVPGDTYSAPVIGADGTIYIGAGGDKALYALNPDGTRKWRCDLGATIYSSPAIGRDGTLYLGNYDGRFFAIHPDGTERWHFDTGSPLSGSAVIDAQGVVYFGSYDNKLYALDAATGAKKWDYATGDIIRATCPVLADDGAIYIGSDDGFVHAVGRDGKLRRTYATAAPILAAPVLSAGRMYVGSTDAKVYAFEIGANVAAAPWPMHRHNLRRFGRALDPLPGMPAISAQPAAATAGVGTPATFTVGAQVPGGGALTYQWRFNNLAIPGATGASFTLSSAQSSDVGRYSVVVTGPGGAVVSTLADLTVNAAATNDSRLINLAVRTTAGGGDRVLFVGFSIGGAGTTGNKPLLLRGVGPTLSGFGVTGVMADPRLQIFSGTNLLLENDDWAGDTNVATISPQVGAFALAAATSKDAAVYTTRPSGSYTAQVSAPGTETGVVLAEIYDATPSSTFSAATPRLVNVSARTLVGTGGNILIAGFAIGGTSPKTVLVRAIGPTLGTFGVTGVLADPKLELFASGGATPISTNDNWGGAINAPQVAQAAASVGAFALPLESKDAVLLVTLPPGSYTAQVSGVNNGTGAAIVEVYEVP